MSISLDNIIQTNTGSGFGTTATFTLTTGTTAGSAVIVAFLTRGVYVPNATVAGFAMDTANSGSTCAFFFRKSNVGAGVTSWTTDAIPAAQSYAWIAMEVTELDLTQPLDSFPSVPGSANGFSGVLNAPAKENHCYEGLAFALHAAYNATDNTIPVWSGWDNDYVEIDSMGASETLIAMGMSVAARVVDRPFIGGTGLDCDASVDRTVDGAATTVVYVAEAGKRTVNLDLLCGFEWGTTAGWALGINGLKVVDTVVGTPAIVSTSPRTGTYCLELSSSAAAESIAWDAITGALSPYSPAISTPVMRISVFFPTALPGSDVELFAIGQSGTSSDGTVTVRYRTASQKLGVQITGTSPATSGTEQLSTNTVSAGTWYSIDVRLDMRTTAWKAAWQINGVDQTTATHTQTIAGYLYAFRVGWGASTTATVRYDDIAFSRFYQNYPLGDIRVYPLKVDPADTPTVSGATANFSVMTSNGTLAAWNATNARNAVDDIPPTLGASADGAVQDTTASTDYMEFPMETRNVVTNREFIRGVRLIFCGWAAGTQAATIGFAANVPGFFTEELAGRQDYNFDTSSTPAWVASMVRSKTFSQSAEPLQWTPARLDDLRAQVGFSSDASPVIGVHSILAELAVRTPRVQRMAENDGATLDAELDDDTGVVAAITLTAPAGTGAAGTYVIRGVTVNTTAPAAGTDVYIVGGTEVSDCTFLSCEPT